MSVTQVLRDARGLAKGGHTAEALEQVRTALRSTPASPGELDRAGRWLGRALEEGGIAPAVEVHLVGQFTTSWLGTALQAVAWRAGVALEVVDAEFDNVVQHVAALPRAEGRPVVAVLLPWLGRLTTPGAPPSADAVDGALQQWQVAWQLAAERNVRVVQASYDHVLPGPGGYHLAGALGEDVGTARRLDEALRAALPPGAAWLDVGLVSGDLGRRAFYDARGDHLARQPLTPEGTAWLAEHVWSVVRATVTGPKKVLVLDLDNTLWGGVVGDEGPLGIQLGESAEGNAFRAFQQHCRLLSQRGIVLAVASKNNEADAREPFEVNPDMVLKLDDFAAFQAHWEPKSLSLQRISDTIRIGLEHFVFFDDNPAEREQVRQALPTVEVVEVPEDPAAYVRALQEGLYFEATAITEADRERAQQYQQEAQRRSLEQQAGGSLEAYLQSLGMQGDVRAVDEADLQRVHQLVGKTNQWNMTTRRHAREAIVAMAEDPRGVALTFRLTDRFGDYGLVGVILAVPDPEDPDTLDVDTWLMSCRVIARTAEQFFWRALVERARALGYRRLRGTWLRTKKNALVSELYGELGGTPVVEGDEERVWVFALDGYTPPVTWVEPAP
ncbi:MAG: HAD-IIIC family phosphatase [Alphaproteobacteria bacterium]|nr:HAD-IIIC family phosphatase [Alphaproteobacteria bacterium]